MEDFLAPLNLTKYKDLFLDNGIEDLETILELEDEHLEQLKMPLGHRLKIAKTIKDMRRVYELE